MVLVSRNLPFRPGFLFSHELLRTLVARSIGGKQLFMAKQKRKLSGAEKAEKKRRRAEFMNVFVNGKQKRVRRPPLIDGLDPDEFIRQNADEIWLHQNEMWEEISVEEPLDSEITNE